MKFVLVESPYAGSGTWPLSVIRRWLNVRYARACLADCLKRGEAPFASHLLYTQPGVLRDHVPEERKAGIDAGLEIGRRADLTAVYFDRGVSKGMRYGLAAAEKAGRPIEFRMLCGCRSCQNYAATLNDVLGEYPNQWRLWFPGEAA